MANGKEAGGNPLHVPVGMRSIPTEWREYEIRDLIAIKALEIGDGYRARNTELAASGVPFARAGNIKNGFQFGDADCFPEANLDRVGNKISEPGDVVFTSKGTVGRFAFVREDTPRFVYSPQLCFWRSRNHKLIDPRFLFFWMFSHEFFVQFKGVAGQTDMAEYVNLQDQRNMRVTLPPLPEQRAIAHVLGTLDDKIEMNRRTNETLESMARALFRSWFVDFDPVHAKAALKLHAANRIRRGETPPEQRKLRLPITPPLRGSRRDKGASPQSSRWGEVRRHYSAQTLQRAHTLRQNRTDAEGLLWHHLRNKQLGGYKFRRQQPIGPYIADFACLPEKLLVELDGGQHAAQQVHDNRRDEFLREKGYRILRFWNSEVFENCFGVLDRVYAALTGSSPRNPAPDGLAAAIPAQGGTHWTVERARAYLDGMEPEIAALFPDRFTASESGRMIPEGWEETTLNGIALLNPETWTARNAPETIVYVDLSNTKWGTIEKYEIHAWQDAPSRAKRVLRTGDTILGTVRPGNGSYAFIGRDGLTGSTGFAVLRPVLPRDQALVWGYATAPENIRRLTHVADGAAYPAIRPQVVGATEISLPSERTRDAFGRVCGPLLNRMEANQRESCALAALRDTLLPKLVSGRIRIPGSELQGSSGRGAGRAPQRSV